MKWSPKVRSASTSSFGSNAAPALGRRDGAAVSYLRFVGPKSACLVAWI
jgi:hypothetical protein